jgi:hypothetical protein
MSAYLCAVLPPEIRRAITFIIYWCIITFLRTEATIPARILLQTKTNSEFSDYRTNSQVDM